MKGPGEGINEGRKEGMRERGMEGGREGGRAQRNSHSRRAAAELILNTMGPPISPQTNRRATNSLLFPFHFRVG